MNNTVTLYLPDGAVLERVTDIIEFQTLGPKTDEAWTYTDKSGHKHRWVKSKGTCYPTLEWIQDEEDYWCSDCNDMYEGDGHWACRRCGEVIVPGMIPGPHTFRVPGLTDWTLDGEFIDPKLGEQMASDLMKQAAER